jgi:hypothetical protein
MLTFNVNAQTPTNGGFENWIPLTGYDSLAGWSSTNQYWTSTNGFPVGVTKTTDAHSGTYALRAETMLGTGGDSTEARVSLGNVLGKGVAFTQQPTALNFWYKYPVANGANVASIKLALTKWNSSTHSPDIVAMTFPFNVSSAVSAYTLVQLPIFYPGGPMAPDTLLIYIVSSNISGSPSNPESPGSVIYVDDMSLDGVTTDAQYLFADDKTVSIYPNPVSESFTLSLTENMKNAEIQIFDVLGKIVYNGMVASINNKINVNDIPTGLYTIRISDGNQVSTKKFLKQ